jgi:tetratricopeptide (TPR) repeat protein
MNHENLAGKPASEEACLQLGEVADTQSARKEPGSYWRGLRIGSAAIVAIGIAIFAGHYRHVSGATAPAAAITIDYPLNESVFPPDMEAPTFLWRDPAEKTASWQIEVKFTDGSPELRVSSKGEGMKIGEIDQRCVGPTNKLPELTEKEKAAHTWKPDAATWASIRAHAVEKAATITINGYREGDIDQPVSSGAMHLTISRDPVGAPIFYRDVPLMPSSTEKGVIKPLSQAAIPLINWRMRDISQPSSHIVMNDLHSCANCHSFSRDGKTMGLDMDGPQNDKGLYAMVPVAQKMSIGTKDMISWASFRKELDPQLRVGFMSQVSPDGRYVATTVKPPHTSSAQFYYVQNFTNYQFLQVFYPTRGIVAIYDRQTKELKPLPGADDPDLLQACAVWSPDGKYLVFLHAKARDPYRADGVRATYSNDPNEVQIQYDLYRIPFNDGKGGIAEPIEGASQNGMSNSFAKVSPDGKWIVFVQAKNGLLIRPDSKLYIVPAQGGTARLMNCNTSLMNSWHSWSPNGRWLVFSSKSRGPYTKLFLTHVDENGNDTPSILIENSTAANRAVNIPEFVNMDLKGIDHIDTPAVDFYKEYDLAVDLTKQGDYTAAIAQWNKTLGMVPDDPRAHNAYGATLAKAGKPNEALAQFRIALEKKPQFAEAHNNAGVLLASSGKPGEAAVEFKAALEVNPEDADAHVNLGKLFMDQHRMDDAIEQFQAAIESNPSSAEAHNNLGFVYASQNRMDDAIGEYNKAIESDPKYSHAYNNLGLAMASKDNLDDAITNFNKAVELDPKDAEAEGNLGHAYLAKNSLDDAIPHLKRAIDLGSDTADNETNLGLALAQENQIGDALPHFERALEIAPHSVNAEYYLGMALIMNGQGEKGMAQWHQALHTDPDNLQVLNEAAWVLSTSRDASLRNGTEALELARRAVQLSSSRAPQILGTLAAAYAEKGSFNQAIETEQQAAELAAKQGDAGLARELNERMALLKESKPIRQ